MSSRPRPVVLANTVAGVVKTVVLVLGFLGFNDYADAVSTDTAVIVSITVGVFTLGGDLLAALHAQAKVTPIHAAQADDGMPLIRADQVVPVPSYITVNNLATTDNDGSAPAVAAAALDVPDADAVLAAADAIHPAS